MLNIKGIVSFRSHHRELFVLSVSGMLFVMGVGGIAYQHLPDTLVPRKAALPATAAATNLRTNNTLSKNAFSSVATGSSIDASSTLNTSIITNTSSTTSSDNTSPDSPTHYAYKLMVNVDPCTFNTLGKDGWVPIQYGTDPNTGDYLENASGKDENCLNPKIYHDFIWILFQRIYQ